MYNVCLFHFSKAKKKKKKKKKKKWGASGKLNFLVFPAFVYLPVVSPGYWPVKT